MEQFARFVVRKPRTVLLGIACVTIVLSLGLAKSEMRAVLEGDLPAEDARVLDDAKLEAVFPERNYFVLNLECPEGVFEPSCLEWLKGVTRAAEQLDGLRSPVQSLMTYHLMSVEQDELHVASLAESEVYTPRAVEDVVMRTPFLRDKIVAQNGRATLMWFAMNHELGQKNLHASVSGLKRAFDDGRHAVHIYSTDYINQEIDNGVARDILVLLPIALGFIGLIVALALVWQAIILFVAVIVLALLWSYGSMGMLGVSQSVLTGSLPGILVAVVSSAGFHLLYRARSAYRAGTSWSEYGVDPRGVENAVAHAITAIGPSIIVSAATSCLGFLTLVVFQILSIREFGFFAGVGIASGGFLSLTLVPAAVVWLLPTVVTSPQGTLARHFEGANHRLVTLWGKTARFPGTIAFAMCVIVLVSVVGIQKVHVGSDPSSFFPYGSDVKKATERFSENFGGSGFVTALFDSGSSDGIYNPAFLEKVAAFQEDAERDPRVVFGVSFIDAMRQVHQAQSESVDTPLITSRNRAAQYALLYSFDSRETYDHMVDPTSRYLTADFLVDANDSARLEALRKSFEAAARELFGKQGVAVSMGGKLFLWSAQNDYIVRGKIQNIFMSVAGVFLMCAVLFRSLLVGVLALIPVSLATLTTFGLMGFVGIRLDTATCAITSIAVGVGVDFAVHFLGVAREVGWGRMDEVLRRVGLPIHYNCLSNFAFLMFLFSAFLPVRNFGWLVSFAMALSTIYTLVVVPALIEACRSLVLSSFSLRSQEH